MGPAFAGAVPPPGRRPPVLGTSRDLGGDALLEWPSEPLGGDLDEAELVCRLPPGEGLALHDALDRLAEVDPASAELVKADCFAGWSSERAAGALGVSRTSVDRHGTYARARLVGRLRGQSAVPES